MIIENIVSQIVIQKDSEDPDPTNALLRIDVKQMVADLIDADKIANAEAKAQKAIEKSKKLEVQLNEVKEDLTRDNRKLESLLKEKTEEVTKINSQLVEKQKDVSQLENLLKERFTNPADGSQILEKMWKELESRGIKIPNVRKEKERNVPLSFLFT